MSYSAYELTAGSSCLQAVEAYCRHLTSGGTFSTATSPTLAAVESLISQTYYQLQGLLAEQGYGTAQTTTAVVGYLEKLNVVGAVVQVELTQPATGGGEGNERFREFKAAWAEGTAFLATDGFEALGGERAERLAEGGLLLTGTSRSRKRSVDADTDLVPARFRRAFGVRHDLAQERADTDVYRTDN